MQVSLPALYNQYQPTIRPILRIGPIFGGIAILFWRVRETRVPVSSKAIIRRSRDFLVILLVLLALRLGLHDYIGHIISPLQTASVFYLLAFGMIARWRLMMYLQYQKLCAVS